VSTKPATPKTSPKVATSSFIHQDKVASPADWDASAIAIVHVDANPQSGSKSKSFNQIIHQTKLSVNKFGNPK